jgi:hypothetical protein
MLVGDKGMTRGSFLRLFGAAPFAGAAFAQSGFTEAAFAQSSSGGDMTLNLHFSGNSYRVNYTDPTNNIDPQTGKPYPDRLVFGGSGQIIGQWQVGQTVTTGQVNAQGSFAHYENNLSPSPPGNNIPLKFTGTWRATNLVSFELLGFWGTDSEGIFPLAAGVLVLDILLVRPATALIPLSEVPSLLTLVSNLNNLKAANLPNSRMPEGITLLAPNDPVNGFFFVPTPFVSTLGERGGREDEDNRRGHRSDVQEAYTPVLFSTLWENRGNAP